MILEQGNINLSAFENFLNNSNIAENMKVDIGDFGIGYKGFAQLKLLPDQDKQRVTDENLELGEGLQGKGVRVNFRTQAQLKAHRYDDDVLNRINSFLSDSLDSDIQQKIQAQMYSTAIHFNSGVYSVDNLKYLKFGEPVPLKKVFAASGIDVANQNIDSAIFGNNLLYHCKFIYCCPA